MAKATCSVDGCESREYVRGRCTKHYQRWRKHGDPMKLVNHRRLNPCSVTGCDAPEHGRTWCKKHLTRWERHGDPHYCEKPGWPENLVLNLRFMPSGCVEFTGAISSTGYGHVLRDGKMVGVHRAAYELLVGPIPDGLHIDHLCYNRPCVNPTHLEPVTMQENLRRAREHSATLK